MHNVDYGDVSSAAHFVLDKVGMIPGQPAIIANAINAVYHGVEAGFGVGTGTWEGAAESAISAATAGISGKVKTAVNVGKTVAKKVQENQGEGEKKSHGNKLDDKPAECYSLRCRNTGEVKKYGETTRGEDKYGEGNQKRYSKKELKDLNVYYKKEDSGTKKDMHQEQHEKILDHKSKYGKRPDYNKNDY